MQAKESCREKPCRGHLGELSGTVVGMAKSMESPGEKPCQDPLERLVGDVAGRGSGQGEYHGQATLMLEVVAGECVGHSES